MGDLLGKPGAVGRGVSETSRGVLTLQSAWILMPQCSDGDTIL